jgi:hypothetical protein
LKLKYDELLSSFGFSFNVRRYHMNPDTHYVVTLMVGLKPVRVETGAG